MRSGAPSCPLAPPDPASVRAADGAGLVFTSDCMPGIRRRPTDVGAVYERDDGGEVGEADVARIAALTLPPAWTDVWISADPRGHLQATGRDSRGRKQYRYHSLWTAVRDAEKYRRLLEFGEALSGIRQAVDDDLRRRSVDRRRVLALAVAVVDRTFVRVGNEQYRRENESFGLTTLRVEHADVSTVRVRLRFRGKSGRLLTFRIDDPRIARALKRTAELPGQELFQYVDEGGALRMIESGDVNAYLHDVSGAAITSKDFRTWGGSLETARVLHELGPRRSADRAIAEAVRAAAGLLGNTPAVCRRSYIHPGILDLYRSGDFERVWSDAEKREPQRAHLREDERVFLGLLRELPDL